MKILYVGDEVVINEPSYMGHGFSGKIVNIDWSSTKPYTIKVIGYKSHFCMDALSLSLVNAAHQPTLKVGKEFKIGDTVKVVERALILHYPNTGQVEEIVNGMYNVRFFNICSSVLVSLYPDEIEHFYPDTAKEKTPDAHSCESNRLHYVGLTHAFDYCRVCDRKMS